MSQLTKIQAENQTEMLILIALLNKKQPVSLNTHDSDSDHENISVARTSTPVKTNSAALPKTTPVKSRNMVTGVLKTLQINPQKDQNERRANSQKTVHPHPKFCSHLNRRHSHLPVYSECRKRSLLRFQSSMVSPKSLNFLRTYFEIISKCTLISWKFKKLTSSTHYYEETHFKRTAILTIPKKTIWRKS